MKKKIIEVVLQIIPVMIGVYLGFVVSNWSEENKLEDQTTLLKTNILAEIESNNTKIEKIIDYHIMIRDSSRYYRNISGFKKMPRFFKGTNTLTLTTSAFETGIQTGLINGLKFEDIQALNNVYTMQVAYKDFNQLLLSGIVNIDFEESDKGIRKFYSFLAVSMTDVVIQESNLLAQYELLLTQLKVE